MRNQWGGQENDQKQKPDVSHCFLLSKIRKQEFIRDTAPNIAAAFAPPQGEEPSW
jgi:hypothetical protein